MSENKDVNHTNKSVKRFMRLFDVVSGVCKNKLVHYPLV